MYSVFALVLIVSILFADTVTQTDWSGGGAVPGPVTEWKNYYDASDYIEDTNCSLLLESSFLEYPGRKVIGGQFDAYSVHPTDIDNDGDLDVVGADKLNDGICWWENLDSHGCSWTEHIVAESFQGAVSVYSADIDCDGDSDILGVAYNGDDVTWWENVDGTGLSWNQHAISCSFNGPLDVFSADFDNDGDPDVLSAGCQANSITLWENADGIGLSWNRRDIDNDFQSPWSVYASDIDGDGDIDALGASGNDSDITWWENADGSGYSWVEHTIDGEFSGAISVYAADVNGDGSMDVVGGSELEDGVVWWENCTGFGTDWVEHVISSDQCYIRSVYASDFDLDGDMDVVASGVDKTLWWENLNGLGTIWEEHILDESVSGTVCISAGDLDGDIYPEILCASYIPDEIAFWKISGFVERGVLESSILDIGDTGEWNYFFSSSQQPSSTSVCFQFRSSNDSSNMGAWSDTVFSPDTPLAGFPADSTRYLQYKVILKTSNPSISPELLEVAFNYDILVGTEESETGKVSSWSLYAVENPSRGFLSIMVSVPEAGQVELSVYDVSGRVIAEISQEFSAGTHSVNIASLTEGVYFCTMRAGSFVATERAIVLK